MKQVMVNLKDLKNLIDRQLEQEIRRRAETIVVTRPGNSDPQAAFEFAQQVEATIPVARKTVLPRYRSLLEALESGKSIDSALESFVR